MSGDAAGWGEFGAAGARWLGTVALGGRGGLTDRQKLTVASMDLVAALRVLEGLKR